MLTHTMLTHTMLTVGVVWPTLAHGACGGPAPSAAAGPKGLQQPAARRETAQGTQGIVVLSNAMSWSPPKEKKKNKKDEDDDDDERSETPSLAPRNLSYSSNRAKVPNSPAKRQKAA